MDINSLTQSVQFKIEHFKVVTSTNTLAKQRLSQGEAYEGLVLLTNKQTEGRGQLNSVWESSAGENIMCSVILIPTFLPLVQQTYLNMAICLAMFDTINKYASNVYIKWPNDIYINNKKVAGLLLENAIQGNTIKYSIAGIGINVNQQKFNIDKATSLSTQTNTNYILLDLLNELLNNINNRYGQLKLKQWLAIFNEYHKHLLGLNKLLTFKTQNEQFEGTILGVNTHGQLQVKRGDEVLNFGVKEISML